MDRLFNKKESVEILEKYLEKPHYKDVYVDLVSTSTTSTRVHEYTS